MFSCTGTIMLSLYKFTFSFNGGLLEWKRKLLALLDQFSKILL